MPKEQSDTAAGGAAVDAARDAAIAVAGAATVGEFLGSQDESEVLGTLTSYHFESLQAGYGGWFWSVSFWRCAALPLRRPTSCSKTTCCAAPTT